MTTALAPDELLDTAATLIEKEGWTQGVYTDYSGCHCAIGALAHVAGIDPTYEKADAVFFSARQSLADAISNPGQTSPLALDSHGVIVQWNDDDDRTQQQVIEAMRTAATNIRTNLAEAS